MRQAFLVCVIAIGIADFVIYRELRLASTALIYAILSLQAQMAAQKLANNGFKIEKAKESPPNVADGNHTQETNNHENSHRDEIPVRAFAKKQKTPKFHDYALEPVAESLEEKTKKTSPNPKRSAFMKVPNFSGSSSDVLGIPENAATKTILRAFRHWIKKYHPDHAPKEQKTVATFQARALTEAKNRLLGERKSKAA